MMRELRNMPTEEIKQPSVISCNLREFAKEFREVALEMGAVIEYDPNTLSIVTTHKVNRDVATRLIHALRICLDSLYSCEADLEEILPLAHLIDYYIKELKRVSIFGRGKVN